MIVDVEIWERLEVLGLGEIRDWGKDSIILNISYIMF